MNRHGKQMPYMIWKNSLSVRIPEIDEQHQNLFEIVNYLYDSMINGRSNDTLSRVLQELVDYSRYHFQTEEDIMERYRYPQAQRHIKEHEYFIVRVQAYVDNYNKGNAVLSIDVVNFIKKWIMYHVERSDQGYSIHLIDLRYEKSGKNDDIINN
jgi:hemerythrin-like metal-binding protein